MTPIRTILLLVLFLFLHTSAYSSSKTIIIKVSSRDCILCNVNLDNVYRYSGTTPKILVLKKDEEEDTEFLGTLNLDKRMNTIVYFSDSLYYKYDSTERSTLYTLENGKVVVKKYLKDVSRDDLSIFASHEDAAYLNIKMPRGGQFINLNTHLGILDRHGKIYRINKNNLHTVSDSFNCFSPAIIEDIYKSEYGLQYQEKLDTYRDILKSPNVRELPPQVASHYVRNDTLYLVVNTYSASVKDDTDVAIDALLNIITFKDGKYVGTEKLLQEITQLEGEDYHIYPMMFFVNRGTTYFQIMKKKLSENNPVLAKMRTENNWLKIDKALPIQLPEMHIKNDLGYNLLTLVSNERYFAIKSYPQLYDISSFRKYELPLNVPTNNVTKKDIEQIKIKLNFNIITFHEENNVMNLIYVSNDTVKHSRCRITQEGLKLELDEVLDNSYSNKKFSYTVADKKGYYLYMKEKQVIEYVPY